MQGAPLPPIIFGISKLLQKIIYRQKGNLLDSPNHSKYWENNLISRFYEQFSRSSQNLNHFGSSKKLLEYEHIIYHFEALDLEIPNM